MSSHSNKKHRRSLDRTKSSTSHRSMQSSDRSPPSSPDRNDGLFPGNLTSRMSVNTVCDSVDKFDDFKRWLVNETGFGGTLHLHRQKKVNLKFSAWVMSKVDTDKRQIVLGEFQKLNFWDSDVHKALGAPCGPREVREAGRQLSAESIKFMRTAIGMDSSDSAHSLKAAEAYLLKDINPSSSILEQHCFKTAYVIFVMGNLFAPGTKHDYSSIDFWYALADADNIQEFNWCEYILEELMKAVSKLKNDISAHSNNSHLAGCHLFFQVFYLDNLDLGALNKKHVNMPRVADFTYETIKRMITMAALVGSPVVSYTAAVLRPPGLVVYTRHRDDEATPPAKIYMYNFPDPNPASKAPTTTTTPNIPIAVPSLQKTNTSSSTVLGALDFSRHLQKAHPNFPKDGVALAMKEFMARQVLAANNLRNTQITDMVSFADKLIAKMAAKCLCCTARGFPTCILADQNAKAVNRLDGRRLDLEADQEVDSSAKDLKHGKHEVAHGEPMVPQNVSSHVPIRQDGTKSACPLEELTATSAGVVAAIQEIYEDFRSTPGQVIFGDCVEYNHEKVDFFEVYHGLTTGSPTKTVTSTYLPPFLASFPHTYPSSHYLQSPGIVIRKQLIANQPLDHELGAILVRRLNQIATQAASEIGINPWVMLLEPDFALAALADMDCSSLAQIRNQFVSKGSKTIGCWLWHAPVFLLDGWCNLAFEMPNKTIHIMDPTAGARGQFSSTRKMKLELAADKILKSLFSCLRTFFNNWPVDEHNWEKRSPILMDTKYSRDQSGICTTFFMTHFGGMEMTLCVSKDNIYRHRQMLLHQAMMIEGNSCSLPHDHLTAVTNADSNLPS